MSQFGELYADYYDLLYKDKNYQQEADYVDRLVRKFHPGATTLLDLGCGTGLTGGTLRDMVDDITGIDISENMVEIAHEKDLYETLYVAEVEDFLEDNDDEPDEE